MKFLKYCAWMQCNSFKLDVWVRVGAGVCLVHEWIVTMCYQWTGRPDVWLLGRLGPCWCLLCGQIDRPGRQHPYFSPMIHTDFVWLLMRATGIHLPLVPAATPWILGAQYGALSLSRSVLFFFFDTHNVFITTQKIVVHQYQCFFHSIQLLSLHGTEPN